MGWSIEKVWVKVKDFKSKWEILYLQWLLRHMTLQHPSHALRWTVLSAWLNACEKLGKYISRNIKQIRLVSFRHISHHLEEIYCPSILANQNMIFIRSLVWHQGATLLPLYTFWKAPLLLVAVWKLQMTSLVVAVSHPGDDNTPVAILFLVGGWTNPFEKY